MADASKPIHIDAASRRDIADQIRKLFIDITNDTEIIWGDHSILITAKIPAGIDTDGIRVSRSLDWGVYEEG